MLAVPISRRMTEHKGRTQLPYIGDGLPEEYIIAPQLGEGGIKEEATFDTEHLVSPLGLLLADINDRGGVIH